MDEDYQDGNAFRVYEPSEAISPLGFQMDFSNGWTVSVSWNPSGRLLPSGEKTAEVARWRTRYNSRGSTDIIGTYVTPDIVASLIQEVASL